MKKRKKKKGLLIGCLFLVALAALYVLVLVWNNREETKNGTEETVTLLSMNRDEIATISYTREDGTYHFVNVNNTWFSEEQPEETLSQSYLVNIRNLFTGTDAEAVVDTKTQNLENYGLDKPSYILSAMTADGKEQTLYIGNLNTSVGQYYAYTNTVEGIYLISKKVVTNIGYSLSEMISTGNLPSFSAENTSVFRQNWNGEIFSLEKKNESVYDISDVLGWFITTGFDHEIGCGASALETLFSDIAELELRKTAAVDVTETDLTQYGLDVPTGSLYLEYTDSSSEEMKIFELLIGDITDGNYYFVKEAQSSKVFTMDKDLLDDILNRTKYDYVYRYPLIVNVRTVERIIFKEAETTYDLSVRTDTASAEDSSTSVNLIYSYQGKELEEDLQAAASSLYSSIISLEAERVVDPPEELGEQLDFSITFERNKEPEKVEVLFYEYNSSYYLCSVNGDAMYLINLRNLENYKNQIFAALDSFE